MPSQLADLDELAIFGGTPAFAQPRHVGRPNIGDPDRVLSLISQALTSRWLTNDGPLVDAFEARVGALAGAEHCVAVSSATSGLQLAAVALGVTGEVIMPSFTFIGTAHAMRWVGLTPVFCEIDPDTHTLDPASAQRAVTPRTGAIVGVHLWGRPGHAQELVDLGRAHDVPVLFDAAHSLGCTTGLGAVEVLSFHATKVANAAEGGAILTSDTALAERLRRMRNFGFVDFDTVGMLGTNAKMSELSAAMGIASLESFDRIVELNRRNYRRYEEELAGVDEVKLIEYAEPQNFQYIVVEVPATLRDDLVAVLRAENLLARRYFHPGCHRHEPYRRVATPLPVTEGVSGRVLTLPTGPEMDEHDIAQACAVIRLAVERAPELQRRLHP
jgi:dTDP-4-amino-4,6-dideoxygalactose transaminase